MKGVSAWSLWLGVKGDGNPSTGIQCRVRRTGPTFPSNRGERGGNQPGVAGSWLELVAELGTEPLCATSLFSWLSLGFSDSCTLASPRPGLSLFRGK